MDKSQLVLRLLEIRLYTIKMLRELTKNNINFVEWREQTLALLLNIFGSNSPLVENFIKIKFHPRKNIHNNVSLTKDEIRVSYIEGLDKAELIVKEALIKYSGICLRNEVVPLHLDKMNLSLEELELIIASLGLPENEKEELEKELQQALKELATAQSNIYEKEIINNHVVTVFNKIQPKVVGFIVFSSLIEILETFLY